MPVCLPVCPFDQSDARMHAMLHWCAWPVFLPKQSLSLSLSHFAAPRTVQPSDGGSRPSIHPSFQVDTDHLPMDRPLPACPCVCVCVVGGEWLLPADRSYLCPNQSLYTVCVCVCVCVCAFTIPRECVCSACVWTCRTFNDTYGGCVCPWASRKV